MPFIDNHGVAIHCEVDGDSGPTVLLTHGYTATASMWRPQIGPLVAAGYRVVTWDIRGHGQSESPADPSTYSEASCVADMAAVLDACGAPRAAVGGLSLGGYLSLAFRRDHPDRVAALLLFDTGPGFKRDDARAKWNQLADRLADGFRERGLDALPNRADVSHDHQGAEGLVLAAEGILRQNDASVIESLPSIAVPTLVLAGEQDKPFLDATDYMAAKIPGARRVIVPDAGHAANLDQPAAFNAAVVEFLAEFLPARPSESPPPGDGKS